MLLMLLFILTFTHRHIPALPFVSVEGFCDVGLEDLLNILEIKLDSCLGGS